MKSMRDNLKKSANIETRRREGEGGERISVELEREKFNNE